MNVISEHIEMVPGVCGGRPKIRGRRITVENIVIWHEHLGYTPDEIVANWPTVTLADVHAALAYYFDHVAEIRASLEESERFVAEFMAKNPSRLAAELAELRRSGPPIPS
jgi:uncharacterized protein (DUF433 family)